MSLEPHYASEAAAAPSKVIDSASEGGGPCFSRQHNDPHDLWGLQEDPHDPGKWYCTSCWHPGTSWRTVLLLLRKGRVCCSLTNQ